MPTAFAVILLLILSAAFTFSTPTSPPARPPLPPDAVAFLSLKSSIDPNGLLRFDPSVPHCRWPGILCSSSPRAVTRFVVESLPLSGSLPASLPPNLDQLRLLSLKNTSLRGRLPDLSPLHNLKSLFLSQNLLSGPLPPSLPLLSRLRSLDLSYNQLSGPIPFLLASLPSLSVLLLHSNNLSGPVPPFNQPSLKTLNLSSNNLSGLLPSTPLLLSFPLSSFSLNPSLCGAHLNNPCNLNTNPSFFPLQPPSSTSADSGNLQQIRFPDPSSPSTYSSPTSASRTHRRAALAAGITAAVMVLLAGLALTVRRKGRLADTRKGVTAAADAMEVGGSWDADGRDAHERIGSSELALVAGATTEEKVKRMGKSGCLVFCAGEVGVYTLEELMRASAEMTGRGTVGTTYKAVLDGRLILSVKRVDAGRMSAAGREDFAGQMEVVGRLRHPNIVPLRAFFHAKEERLLVYDYQPNGSLHSLIHGSRSTRAKPLHWTSCLKIAEDVAQGLAYIHQASRLVHGNIKSSNILLGSDFEACLTDCCLASLVEPLDGEEESGYRAPEVRSSNRNLTPKSDIYAFGILLLEILTGKPPLPHPFLVATDLPTWIRSVREEDSCKEERLMMLLDIARECIRSAPESRPSTWQVLKMIQEIKNSDVGDELDAAGFP